jgi:hypothetical protein
MTFVKNARAPVLRKTARGQKTYCWRLCPYSLEDIHNRLPNGERSAHTTTSGKMALDIRDGHDGIGWVCLDDACSFYTGVATSGIPIEARVLTLTVSGEYGVDIVQVPTEVCSGTRFWEK